MLVYTYCVLKVFFRLLFNCFQQKETDSHWKGTFLIVAPSSVLYNWEDELSTWGHFKVGRFHKESKMDTIERASRGKLDVVVTTYETFRSHVVSKRQICAHDISFIYLFPPQRRKKFISLLPLLSPHSHCSNMCQWLDGWRAYVTIFLKRVRNVYVWCTHAC